MDKDGNEISRPGKWIAGILLISFTALSVIVIIAYWPDKLPSPKDNVKPLYTTAWFHVRLANIPDPGQPATANESIIADKLIHLNILLLLLVAVAGILGNLIHIATSFTTYIGAGQFRKSWILWYCVKPFTAAALAIGIYFVFCTGLLNMGQESGNVNLYGIMTISLLAGLFTDRTTLKLKEVFDVLMRPKEERPNSLDANLKVTAISPDTVEKEKVNIINITGEHLDKKKFSVTINDEVVPVTDIKPAGATVKYTIPETQKGKNEFVLVIKNEQNEVIGQHTLKLAGTGNDGTEEEPVG